MTRERKQAWLVGIGLDSGDGHTRVTHGDEILLVGGSRETHESMQDHVIRVRETLVQRGRTLAECSREEVAEILRETAG